MLSVLPNFRIAGKGGGLAYCFLISRHVDGLRVVSCAILVGYNNFSHIVKVSKFGGGVFLLNWRISDGGREIVCAHLRTRWSCCVCGW